MAEGPVGDQTPEAGPEIGVTGQPPVGTLPGLGGVVIRPDGSIVVPVLPQGRPGVSKGPEILLEDVQADLQTLQRVVEGAPSDALRGVVQQQPLYVLVGDAVPAAAALVRLVPFLVVAPTPELAQRLEALGVPPGRILQSLDDLRSRDLDRSPLVVEDLAMLRYHLWQHGFMLPELAPVLAAYDQAAVGLEQYFAALA